jgi:Cof subfamily protein (haloacid dehalogenase superfamily)
MYFDMAVKLVVTDLDNTLLRRDKTVSEYTKSIFNRLRERNILLAFATSRPARASARVRSMIAPDIEITSGGAIATMNGKTLFRAAIDAETAHSIIHGLKASEYVLQITADTEDCYFSSKPVDMSLTDWEDYSESITTDFSDLLPVRNVLKITPNATNAEAVLRITSRYPAVDVLNFTGENWYQIKSVKAAKHYAIAEICTQLGFSMSNAVSFGDDYNDIEMLRECGIGVAVANAIDEVKAVADHICDASDNDGVAKWIDETLLI